MSSPRDAEFTVHLPTSPGALDQDEEFCTVEIDGERRHIRFHEYAEIYQVPGLYEHLFYDLLGCTSPSVVVSLLADELRKADIDPADLVALDFGAGNGMVGERLRDLGVSTIVGVDLLEEARDAALRDRPEVYEDYIAADVTSLTDEDRRRLSRWTFTCLLCVAALGFDDVPPPAFATVFNLIAPSGWLAFNIRARFAATGSDQTGFSALLRRMIEEDVVRELARTRYTHRRSVSGEELPYVAVIARKQRDIPLDWLSQDAHAGPRSRAGQSAAVTRSAPTEA